ncbi:hypothetical protein [Bacillus sp. K2I17]|uniref:hypothetical protein n=1 Tax=Bacillus sp. K2I17 TaxID=2014743 RepID=UPI0011551763|nr:hypothetical protein [Bacillus sp. K2I17]
MRPLCVKIVAFVAPGADVSGNRIENDIEAANEIWSTCNIYFHLDNIITITDNSLEFKDREIVCQTNQPDKFKALMENYQMNLGWQDYWSIPVFYVGGSRFQEGENGCGGSFDITGIRHKAICVILTNDARPFKFISGNSGFINSRFVLAHEFGHVLFYDPNTQLAINPSPSFDTSDIVHDTLVDNLMYRDVNAIPPEINRQQCEKARKSPFAKDCISTIPRSNPPFLCRKRLLEIEHELKVIELDINALGEDLKEASPQRKGTIGSQIHLLLEKEAGLKAAKASLLKKCQLD